MSIVLVTIGRPPTANCKGARRRGSSPTCTTHGASTALPPIVRTRSDVADLLHVRVAGIVLGGSSLSLSTRLQLETISHATAMVSRFPFANVMGVCFGHQVFASLFGGAVGRLAEYSQGWVPVALNGSDRRLSFGTATTPTM